MVSKIPHLMSTESHPDRSQNFDTEADWNIVTEQGSGVNGRQVKVSRGKFLGGSSGVNGTLCIRGTKQDFDDWNMPGWSGEEVFGYMKKVYERI
jgi:choline dehydrogenase-like flavoprotein